MADESNGNADLEALIEWREKAYCITVPVFVAFCLLVMVTNLSVLITLKWLKTKLTPTLRLTVSLAVSDVWTSTVVAISMVYNSYLAVVHHMQINACVALTFEGIRTGGLLTGCLHLLALSVNHYLLIVKPFLYTKMLTPKTTVGVIVLLWVVPPSALLAFFASMDGQGYRSEDGHCLNVAFFHKLQFRLVIFSLICTLFVVMSILYLLMLNTLNEMEKRFSKTRQSVPSKQLQQLSKKRKVFITSLLIWGTFFIGWIPSSVIFVLTCATCPFPYSQSSAVAIVFSTSVLANFCILIKSLINPVIYAVRIPEIRCAMSHLFKKNRPKDSRTNLSTSRRQTNERGGDRYSLLEQQHEGRFSSSQIVNFSTARQTV